MKLLYPTVNKYCTQCYMLKDDSCYFRAADDDYAWWLDCGKCRAIK